MIILFESSWNRIRAFDIHPSIYRIDRWEHLWHLNSGGLTKNRKRRKSLNNCKDSFFQKITLAKLSVKKRNAMRKGRVVVFFTHLWQIISIFHEEAKPFFVTCFTTMVDGTEITKHIFKNSYVNAFVWPLQLIHPSLRLKPNFKVLLRREFSGQEWVEREREKVTTRRERNRRRRMPNHAIYATLRTTPAAASLPSRQQPVLPCKCRSVGRSACEWASTDVCMCVNRSFRTTSTTSSHYFEVRN